MNNDQNNQLDRFIRNNAPLAPAPPKHHEQLVISALKRKSKIKAMSLRSYAIAVFAAAACITGLLWVVPTNTTTEPASMEPVQDILAGIIEDHGQNGPTSNPAYEDWDLLAESVNSNATGKH
jgi:hypothetical protein